MVVARALRLVRKSIPILAGAGLALAFAIPASARLSPGDHPHEPDMRVDAFAGWFHDAGAMLLHVSNRGYFGRRGGDSTNPSCEWPAGSNNEYLFAAGLWVGGVIQRGGQRDTLCSIGSTSAGNDQEFRNFESDEGCGDPPEGICETFEGAPSGLRRFDDDGDTAMDEDPLDGADNDGDGQIDEDYAGISQEMFRAVTYDTSTFLNQFFPDPVSRHNPIGLLVEQESYAWTDPLFDDFVGIEYKITNMSRLSDPAGIGWDVNNAYVGFMVDGDVGFELPQQQDYWSDDQGGFATLDTVITTESGATDSLSLTLGYIYDQNGGESAEDDVPGYLGVMFLGHTVDTISPDFESSFAPREVGIHAFRVWTSGDQDDRDDLDRYRFLRGLSDTGRTIDQNTTRANDYRFLVSAGPFRVIPRDSSLVFQVAFVCGNMVERTIIDNNGNPITRLVPDFTNPIQAQRVYNGDDTGDEVIHWATSSPPPPPQIRVIPGDESVVIEWNDFPEDAPDPLTGVKDFAGYQVWKAEGWRRESNVPSDEMWRLIADYDTTKLADIDTGLTGIGKYRSVDTRVKNGFWYWYAVTAYDHGIFRIVSIDSTVSPPDTVRQRVEGGDPKFGKYTQTMQQVMAGTTPAQTLDDVYVVPNPYRANAAWDLAETPFEPTGRRLRFFNLPPVATIRIFTLAGDHVATIDHNDAVNRSEELESTSWNLISKNEQDTVSEIYIYHVETPDGQEKIGKFVVIR